VNAVPNETAFEATETETWSFDWAGKPAAVAAFGTYFTAAVTGIVNASQLETAKHNAMNQDNKCNFWHGDPLAVSTTTFGPGKSVTCTPVSPGVYAARTGWSVVVDPAAPINVEVSEIYVASESLQIKSGKKKFSFTLTENSLSRLTALTIELVRLGDPDVVLETRTLGVDFFQTLEGPITWDYEENAGTFGNTTAQASLVDGDVSAILASDDFVNNDGTGGTRANIDDQSFTVDPIVDGEGTYVVRFSGTIKGNAFTKDAVTFSLDVTAVVIGGCS
jgi:hypothetical protein